MKQEHNSVMIFFNLVIITISDKFEVTPNVTVADLWDFFRVRRQACRAERSLGSRMKIAAEEPLALAPLRFARL